MRQAELRVRGAGSSRARAAVEPDAEGGRADADGAPETGAGAGQGPREVAEYERFRDLVGQVTEVNEAICAGPPGRAGRRGRGCPFRDGRGKGGLRDALAQEQAAELGRLAAEAARALGCGDAGLEAAEQVIRAGLLRLGGGMLGSCWPPTAATGDRACPCGQGHEAVFVGYRDKVIDTVLGPVTLTRAWYHCAECGHGLAPRDAELGVAGHVHVAGPGRDERPGRRRRAVRAGRPPAGGTGRGPADRQAGRAGSRGQRRRRRGSRPGARPAHRRPQAGPAAALAAAGQALRRHRRHRRPHDRQGDRRAGTGKGEDGRARTREVKLAVFFTQDKLDKDGYPVRDRDSTSVIATFEPAAVFGGPGEGRGHPPRRGPRPPAHHPRRRRRLDLGHRHRQVPRGHPDRGPVPRPRAPARPRPQAGVHAAGPQGRVARRPPGGPRLRLHRRHRRRHPRSTPSKA